MTEALAITTENVLHPRQTVELTETKAKLQGMLGAAPYIRNQLQQGGALVQKQIDEIDRMLLQAPQPIPAHLIDTAIALEKQLRESWLEGMPTQAEMRRNWAGCVDKNMAWENRSKPNVLKWKQLKRKLHASGISEHRLADEGDISNIEKFRPRGGYQEDNMDNAQIPQRAVTKLPPPGAGPAVVMSEADRKVLAEVNPGLLDQMGTFTNEQRSEVLTLVRQVRELEESAGAGEAQAVPSRSAPKRRAYKKRAKRPRSPAQLASDARLREVAKARNADRAAPKAGQEG